MLKNRVLSPVLQASLLFSLTPAFATTPNETGDIFEMGFEQLMNIKVYAASKYQQDQSAAPSSVTVVTADDIRSFGWRHLADLLRAQRGMYFSSSRVYGSLGVRGMLINGDLNTRLLVTVDGHRFNDAVYEQTFILNDFVLNTDLIERVEIIRGPSSTLHGATPIMGVINIVSRDPQKQASHLLGLNAGSHDKQGLSYSYSTTFENQSSLLLSAQKMRSDGESLYFNQPPDFTGYSHNDFERVERLFGKYHFKDTQIQFAYSKRDKGAATGAFSTLYDHQGNHFQDTQMALNGQHTWRLTNQTQLNGRLYVGSYQFLGGFVVSHDPADNVRMTANALWHGTEWKLTHQGEQHTLVTGLEYQRNARQHQRDLAWDSDMTYLDNLRRGQRMGIFVQDEWRYQPNAALTMGLRYDVDQFKQAHWTPKLAWILNMADNKNLKLIYSSGYRPANVYEMYYESPPYQWSNTALRSEKAHNYEAVFEHALSAQTHYTINPFIFQLQDNIAAVGLADGSAQFQNVGDAKVKGIEFELQHQFSNQAKLRGSYSWQRSENQQGSRLADSPQHLATLNYKQPLLGEKLSMGLEMQYIASRLTITGQQTAASTLVNANFSGQMGPNKTRWALGIHNLLDEQYDNPAYLFDTRDPSRDRVVQERRQVDVSLQIPF